MLINQQHRLETDGNNLIVNLSISVRFTRIWMTLLLTYLNLQRVERTLHFYSFSHWLHCSVNVTPKVSELITIDCGIHRKKQLVPAPSEKESSFRQPKSLITIRASNKTLDSLPCPLISSSRSGADDGLNPSAKGTKQNIPNRNHFICLGRWQKIRLESNARGRAGDFLSGPSWGVEKWPASIVLISPQLAGAKRPTTGGQPLAAAVMAAVRLMLANEWLFIWSHLARFAHIPSHLVGIASAAVE